MRVDKQLAIKLKEKGFNVRCNFYYNKSTDEETSACVHWKSENFNSTEKLKRISAPDLHTVTDWMRTKGLHVCADPYKEKWSWNVFILNNDELVTEYAYNFETHDSAILAGITAAIEVIK